MYEVAPTTPPFSASSLSASSFLVARVAAETAGVGVGDDDRLLGHFDGVHGGFRADVGQVDDNAQPVHFPHRIHPEVAQAAVEPLPAAAPQQIGLVIGELDDSHPQGQKQPQAVQLVLYGRGVLKSQDDSGLSQLLGGVDIGRFLDLQDVLALAKTPHPAGQVSHGLLEVFPGGHGGVDGGDVTGPQALEHGIALPVADAQAVDHDGFVIDLPGVHTHQSFPP